MQKKQRKIYLLSALLLLLLAGCGSDTPPTQSGAGDSTAEPAAEPAIQSTAVVQGDTLPGRLLFVQKGVIWLWSGGEARPFIGKGAEWQPAWSPDGTKVAYIERGESYSDVMVSDSRGRHLEQLTFNGSDQQLQSQERIYDTMWSLYPSWSPNGETITMVSQYSTPTGSPAIEYNLSLYAVPAEGGKRTQFYADDEAHCGRTVYVPAKNGDQPDILVFVRASLAQDGSQQLYLLDRETDESTPFPGAPTGSYDPDFSPDGNWLAFAARDNDQTDIWVLPANLPEGSNPAPQRVTHLGTARAPAFAPDGSMLAFLAIPEGEAGFELWVADLVRQENGAIQVGEPHQVTDSMVLDADSGLSWAP